MSPLSLLARRSRAALIGAVVAGALGGAGNTAFLALVNARLGARAGDASLATLGGFAAVAGALVLTYLASRLLLVGLVQRTIHELRAFLARRLCAAPLGLVERLGPARLLTIATEDIATIGGALGLLPAVAINAVMAVGSLAYLGTLSLPLLAALVGLLALAVVSFAALDALAARSLAAAREATDAVHEDLADLVHGNRELKLSRDRRRALLEDELASHLESARRLGVVGNARYALATTWGQLVTVVLIGGVLFVVPEVMSLDTGVLRGYALAIIQITGALGALLEAAPALRRASIGWAKVEQVEAELGEVPAQQATTPPRQFATLELRGVELSVERPGEAPFLLGPLELTFRPGEVVFVTGGNGSGKTTLARLLVGLVPPTAGAIALDGAEIDDARRDDYRQLFSATFTDGHVFRSLLGLDAARVRAHLRELELEDVVGVEGGAFSTVALSQGQRKRLLLATALAEDRPFYVLDEWTANQDPELRERFYQRTLPALRARGKAVLVITHDDRYLDAADVVLRLDAGKLVSRRAQAQPEASCA